MAPDLDDAVARLLKRGGGGRSSREVPLLVDLGAMAARDALKNALAGWVRVFAMGDWPADDVGAIALRLVRRLDFVRLQPEAGEVVRDVTTAVAAAQRAVDRAPDMLPAGNCDGCGAMVYGEAQAASALCVCGAAMVDIAYRREAMVRQADVLGTDKEIALTLAAIGRKVSDGTIRMWASRGRLEQRPGKLYRLSDVLALVAMRDARAS